MQNKMKLFGIGAAVLMTLLALTPTAYGQTMGMQSGISVAVTQVNNDGDDFLEQLIELLESYETEMDLLCQYQLEYYLEHGEIPEEFPPELQVMWDAIVNAINDLIDGWDSYEVILPESAELLSIHRGSSPIGGVSSPIGGVSSPIGGGITKIEGPFPYFSIIPPEIGIAWRVWLDHDFVEDLSVASAMIAFLSAFGPIGIIVAIVAVGTIVGMKLTDQGNGVTFLACFLYISLGGPGFALRQLQPQ